MGPEVKRWIVKRAFTGYKGVAVFSSSYGGAESMYDSEAKAIRQAQGEGDKVYELCLTNLDSKGLLPNVMATLVFTQEKETK